MAGSSQQTPAAVPDPTAGPGAELTVYLLTMGPGTAVWERFGHNAIWIRDAARGTDVAYNWGLFSFRQEHFVKRFLRGEMLYWMDGFDVGATLEAYRRADRTVWAQELALTPAQRAELRDFVEWNALPENRFYAYDYYRDNCSTRVRDALDRVLGGRIRQATDTVFDGGTYRDLTREAMIVDVPVYTGTMLLLARMTDLPISAWQEMFIPMQLRDHLRGVRASGPDGRDVPLVRSERVLYEARRDPGPTERPWLTWAYLAGSALVGGALILLGRAAGSGAGLGRAALATAGAAWSLVAGLFGVLLVFLWGFTYHESAYWNENLFQVNPLSLALAALLPVAALREGLRAHAARLALVVAGVAALGAAIQVLPGLDQVNGEIVALALPVHAGLALALLLAARRSPPAGA